MSDTATAPAPAADTTPAAAPDTTAPSQDTGGETNLSTDEAIAKVFGKSDDKPGGDVDLGREAPEKPKDKTEPKADEKPADDKGEAKDAKATEAKDEKPAAPKEKPAEKPKADAPKSTAPDRFNDGAKQGWDQTPEHVRHEVTRMQRELESGIAEHKTRADEATAQLAPVKDFLERAKAANVDAGEAVKAYVETEQALLDDPRNALATLVENYMPGGMQAFFEAFLSPGQGQAQPNAEMTAMRREIQRLTEQVQTTAATAEQQAQAREAQARQAAIERFAAENPRVGEPEIENEMARLLKSGYIDTSLAIEERLSQAYAAATRLIPGAAADPAPPPAPQPHTPQEPTSLSGAPSGGSYPRDNTSLSTEDAIAKVFGRRP